MMRGAAEVAEGGRDEGLGAEVHHSRTREGDKRVTLCSQILDFSLIPRWYFPPSLDGKWAKSR